MPSLGSINYVENSGPQYGARNASFSGAANYAGGYVTFSIATPSSSESLNFPSTSTASTSTGVVTVVGTTVYVGTGTAAKSLGSIDSTYDGTSGVLKVNFGSSFVNGSFSTATASRVGDVVTLAGWTVYLKNIQLGYASHASSDSIGGFVAAVDLSPFPTSSSGTSRGDNFAPSGANYGYSVLGELRLYSTMTTAKGGDVVHGPYVISNEVVRLEAGDSISFKWRAEGGGDAYDVYAYLLNVDTGSTFELLNQTSQTANSTPMAAKTVTIANGGNYKFVFVSGTFDATFGKAAGASLYIDDVTIAQINAMSINSELIQSLASIIQYNNTADDFTVLSRTISMTANTASNEAVTVTGNILITPVNDPPSILQATTAIALPSIYEDQTVISGGTVIELFNSRFSDVDSAKPLGGIIVIDNTASYLTQGKWQYSTNAGTAWSDIAAVTSTSGLALSASTKLRFLPVADFSGTPTGLTVHLTDSAYQGGYSTNANRDTEASLNASGVSTNSVQLGTTILPVQDAPVITFATLPLVLPSTNEDQGLIAGRIISTLVSSRFSDVDVGDVLGGLIVAGNSANSSTQGRWQYSTDSGLNWFDVSTVSTTTGLALSANSMLRFVPVTNFNGTPGDLTVYLVSSLYSGGFTNGATRDTEPSLIANSVSTNSVKLVTNIAPTNDSPQLLNNIQDQVVYVGGSIKYSIANAFVDFDVGDNLSFTATLADGKSALPSWLKFSPVTATFTGAPSRLDAKTINVLVTATDREKATVSDTFEIKVSTDNAPPVAKPISKPVTIFENASFNYELPVGTFTDVNVGDKLTYSFTSLFPGLSINPISGTIYGKVGFTAADVPNKTLTIKATDKFGLFVTTPLTLNVVDVPALMGSSSSDRLVAGLGNDRIWGKGGDDTLTGGAGADEFNFEAFSSFWSSTITDYVHGTDKLRFSLKVFTALGSLPSTATQAELNANLFESGSALANPTKTSTRLFFNQTNSTLFYDPDGSGSTSPKLVAILTGVTNLASSDIYIF